MIIIKKKEFLIVDVILTILLLQIKKNDIYIIKVILMK